MSFTKPKKASISVLYKVVKPVFTNSYPENEMRCMPRTNILGVDVHVHWICFGVLLFFALGYEACSTFIMDVIGSFYASISALDEAQFKACLIKASLVVVGTAIVKAASLILTELYTLFLRERIVFCLHNIYLSNPIILSNRFDNVDQRITQDTDLFTEKGVALAVKLVTVPFVIVYYTWKLWSMLGWIAPTACYAYFMLGYVITSYAMQRVVGLVYQHEKLEGNFRYLHVGVRNALEAIFFLQGESAEHKRLDDAMGAIVDNQMRVISAHIPLYLSANIFSYVGSIVNYAAIGVCMFYFRNTTNSEADSASVIAEGSYACLYLISSFSAIIEAFETLSDLLALGQRIDELQSYSQIPDQKHHQSRFNGFTNGYIALDDRESLVTDMSRKSSQDSVEVVYITHGSQEMFRNALTINNLDIFSNDKQLLISSLSLEITTGMKLLISGPSGVGKSTLIRTLAGMPDCITKVFDSHGNKSSIVSHIPRDKVMFISQQLFCHDGSLADNIVYPKQAGRRYSNKLTLDSYERANIEDCLNKVGLLSQLRVSDDASVLTSFKEWTKILSPGMKQKLIFARILYHKPSMVFLDESTSSIDESSEIALYNAIFQVPGITVISIGHRESLVALHSHRLKIFKAGYEFSVVN